MNRTKPILWILLLAFSSSAFANPFSPAEIRVVQKKKATKFDLIYVGHQETTVEISIYNSRGDLVKEDIVEKKMAFIRTYDFSNLAPGEYKFQADDGSQVLTEAVVYDPARTTMKLGLIAKEDHKLKVIVTGFDTNEPVVVRIYDPEGILVLTDRVESNKGFEKIYDLNKVPRKQYTVTATNGSSSVLRTQRLPELAKTGR